MTRAQERELKLWLDTASLAAVKLRGVMDKGGHEEYVCPVACAMRHIRPVEASKYGLVESLQRHFINEVIRAAGEGWDVECTRLDSIPSPPSVIQLSCRIVKAARGVPA